MKHTLKGDYFVKSFRFDIKDSDFICNENGYTI